MYRELIPCKTVELHAFSFRMLRHHREIFLGALTDWDQLKKTTTTLNHFVYVSKRIVFCILLIYKTINLKKDTKQMLQVERIIKNDFICRCRYCTMVCIKKERKRKYNCWWMFCSIIRTHQGFSVLKVLWFFSHIHCADNWDALHHGIVFFSSLAWQNRRRVFISLRNGSVSVT